MRFFDQGLETQGLVPVSLNHKENMTVETQGLVPVSLNHKENMTVAGICLITKV